jgi:hypothetical protein
LRIEIQHERIVDAGRQVRWVYTPDIKEKESWQGVEMKYARFPEDKANEPSKATLW